MIRTEPGFLAEQLERDPLLSEIGDVCIDVFARALDCTMWRFCAIRTASLASAKPCLLCRRHGREEGDVIAFRPARRTRWTAIDSRRRDRVKETVIGGSVPLENGFPGHRFIHGRRLGLNFRFDRIPLPGFSLNQKIITGGCAHCILTGRTVCLTARSEGCRCA